MATIRVKILDIAAFVKLFRTINQGQLATQTVVGDLMNGEFELAWDHLQQNANYVFSPAGFKELMEVAVKYGIAKFVVEATPLKRSFTMFGIEVGF